MKKNFERVKLYPLMKMLLLTMRFLFFSFFVGVLTVNASNTYSQNKTFDLNFSDKTLGEVFKGIESESEFIFFYLDDAIDVSRKVSLTVSNSYIEEVLDEIFKNTNNSYKIFDRQIIIFKDESLSPVNSQSMVPLTDKFARQSIVIKGKITDSNGLSLPGVNVLEKGTSNGTVTNLDGEYTISVVSPSAVLSFSYVGYLTEELNVENQTTINVVLVEDIQALDEVVVVGYGAQKRSNVTGAISSVKSDDLEHLSVHRVDEALRGKAAGVMVASGSGQPGKAPSIHIRGVGSLGETSPLWIVDGVRMGTGNYFDIADIESIEILKDASASAIYGAQSAHGVILVTTKRGKNTDKLNVNFKANFGKSSAMNMPELLKRDQYIQCATQSREAAGMAPETSWSESGLPDTDWLGAFYDGSGLEQSYTLSISNGNDKANYYLSGGYDDEDGIVIDNKFQRYSLRANSDFKLFSDRVRLGESFLISRTVENPTTASNSSTTGGGIPWRSIPLFNIYDETNEYGGWGIAPTYFQGANPIGWQRQNHVENKYNRFDGNTYLEIDLLEGLMFRTTFGINYYSFTQSNFVEAYYYGGFADTMNKLSYTNTDYQNLTANYILSYEKSLGNHEFKVMAGYEAIRGESVTATAAKTNLPLDVSWSLSLATGDASVTGTVNKYAILSQFGRFNYNYNEKYLLEASVRRDASSPKFGSNNLWGVFPSLSAGWRISEEDFLKDIDFISNLKLRVSSGTLGSDNISSFLYTKTYSNYRSNYAFDVAAANKVAGFYLSKFSNEDVKWEEITMNDIGVDLGILDNKFFLTMDYYVKKTSDMLYAIQLPPTVGLSYIYADTQPVEMNIGEMKNSGFEVALNYREQINDLRINISANSSFMKNELTKLVEDASITSGNAGIVFSYAGASTSRSEVGMPLGSFYGYEVEKIFQSDSEVEALNALAPDGIYQASGTAAGDFKYKDLNGDNEITEDDRTFLGNPWPKMIYGFTTSLEWRNLDLNIFLQGVQGVDIFNGSKALYQTLFSDYNASTQALNAWTAENPTDQPRLHQTDPNGNFRKPSSYFVENGAYLKVRNVQLGYNLPASILKKINVERGRIFVNVDNLLTFTKYSGIDPELAGSNTARGIDNNSYPQTRTVSFGINLGL